MKNLFLTFISVVFLSSPAMADTDQSVRTCLERYQFAAGVNPDFAKHAALKFLVCRVQQVGPLQKKYPQMSTQEVIEAVGSRMTEQPEAFESFYFELFKK